MADTKNDAVTYSDALSALTSLAYCGDIAFLSSIVGQAKPAFKERVESALVLAMEIGISYGWSECTSNEFVWTGHEPYQRVLEVKCSSFCKNHARKILGQFYGEDGKRTYLGEIPGILPDLERERTKYLPNLGKYREVLTIYLKDNGKESARTEIPRLAAKHQSADHAIRKKQVR